MEDSSAPIAPDGPKVEVRKAKKQSQLKEIWRRMKKNRAAILGLVIFTAVLAVAVFADQIVPYGTTTTQNYRVRLQPPSKEHWFGTDSFGRDVFARVVHGSRISLSIGLTTSLVSLVIGGLLGAITGYYGGRFDNVLMRIVDIIGSIPTILLNLTIVSVLGASIVNLFIAMTVTAVPGVIRLVRSTVLNTANQDYVEAARSYGAKDLRIILLYVLPNGMGPIIVNTTMSIAGAIMSAASLSFIGVGVQPPVAEWGAMLNEAKGFIRSSAYLLYFPGIAIMLSALSLNLIGDGLRDALDPKLKN
jgi:peptide/nickel transport system permease protein